MEESSNQLEKKVIVIGGSAGSLELILFALPNLREDLTVPIVIVLHRKATNDELLTELLKSKTKLLVKEAEEKEALNSGCIYICPANYHLLIENDFTFSLDYSEKVNFSRPSIDVTFQSAADIYGNGTACILLSGGNNDGTIGLLYVKNKDGKCIVQDPLTCQIPFMPKEAISKNAADLILKPEELIRFINSY